MDNWDDDTVVYPPPPPNVNTPWFRAKSPADPATPEDGIGNTYEYLRGYHDGIARGRQEAFYEIDRTQRRYSQSGIESDGRQGMG